MITMKTNKLKLINNNGMDDAVNVKWPSKASRNFAKKLP